MIDHLYYVTSYYDQPSHALRWWENMGRWDDSLLDKVTFIFVDDGSPRFPLVIPDEIKKRFKVRHFRILVDIPWNDMGARNLGMKHVNGWALMTDSDYMLAGEEARKILALNADKRNLYQPMARLWGKTEFLHLPCNKFICHSDTYWQCGGYAEQYAGHYGFSDTEFMRTHQMSGIGKTVLLKDDSVIWIEHVSADWVTWLDRSMDHNSGLFIKRKQIAHQMGGPMKLAQSNLHIQFPWREETCDSSPSPATPAPSSSPT